MNVSDPRLEYFSNVQFVVEATFEEQHLLWLTRHHHDVGLGHVKVWDSESLGRAPTIAVIGGRPLVVSIYYATLDGVRVAFYEATSEYVDHKYVKDWIEGCTRHIKTADGRPAHTDVGNFHDVIHEIQDREDKRQRRLR